MCKTKKNHLFISKIEDEDAGVEGHSENSDYKKVEAGDRENLEINDVVISVNKYLFQ